MERILGTLILCVLLSGCNPTFIKRFSPYEQPIPSEVYSECVSLPKLETATDWTSIMEQKVLESSMYKLCADKHSALRKVLKRLDDEQIIRITTP